MLTYDSFAKALAFFSPFVKTRLRFLVDDVFPEGGDTLASSSLSESLSKLINAEGAFW